MHPEGLQASQILDMEKTFREYPYPWLTTLLMREVVQQYCPLKENRKDMPSMATLMIPSIKSILYQETWDFIMLVLMPALVDYLSPLGWQLIYTNLSWMLHSQTTPLSELNQDSSKIPKPTYTDCFPQSLPEGWTQQLVRVGRDIGHPMEKLSLTDHLLQTLEDILIDRAAKTPEYMQELVEHVIAADNIKSGRMLRWLSCDETIKHDNPTLRRTYTRLYAKVISFGGDIYRTERGPRITIPTDQWKNWDEMDYKAQKDFSWIIYMMTHQFNREMWNRAIQEKSFIANNYFVDLMWETGAYSKLNDITINEFLREENSTLNDSYEPAWINIEDKPNIFLEGSWSRLYWDKKEKGWYRMKNDSTWSDNFYKQITGGEWPNQTNPDLWATPPPTHDTSMWGSPSHSNEPIDIDQDWVQPNLSSSSLPNLMDCTPESLSSCSSDSSLSSYDPKFRMVESQFLDKFSPK